MGVPWVVHEGYVLVQPPASASVSSPERSASPTRALHALATHLPHTKKLVERYVVIYMNRKMEFYDAATVAPSSPTAVGATPTHAQNDGSVAAATPQRRKIGDALYVSAFAGWDGDGLLKVGESYGLELKVDPKPHGSGRRTTSLFLAAFNRVDLEKWCRALVAVLDPQSAAGEDVRREHRRERKEAKRLEQEREEKIRKWRELKLKQLEEERERALAREEEISNMTPLERVDGLGSLDDDTARLLEKRKLRLQRRHAPTTGRMNKAAYRKRIDEGAGGKLENVQPLQPKVVETKLRVRVELPLPGQFIEAAGVSSTHRIGLPHAKDHAGLGSSSSGSSSHETPSDTSSVSSNSHSGYSASQLRASSSNGHRQSFVPPPPPPPPHALMMLQQQRESSLRGSFVPPPPPRSGSGFVGLHHDNGDNDHNYDADDRRSEISRASFSQSRRRLSGVDREKIGAQDNLAAILSGGRATRRDSIDSTASALSVAKLERRKQRDAVHATAALSTSAEPMMVNAFAASLAAIRRNRADTMDDTSAGSSESPVTRELNGKVRTRKRESQLSAEGKELLQHAIGADDRARAPSSSKPQGKASNGRKGLFDDSDSDDDSDAGLFATSKARVLTTVAKRNGVTAVSREPDHRSSTTPTSSHSSVGVHRPSARGFDDADDDDSDATDASRSGHGNGRMFATKTSSPNSTASFVSGTASPSPPRVSVAYITSAVRTEGKKPTGFYTFAFRVGALEHTFTHSFNELEAMHLRLAAEWPTNGSTAVLPKFPSKHRLRNNTKPENMHKRALEFVAYFEQLLAVPALVAHPRFVFEFRIDDRFAQALRGESSSAGVADSVAVAVHKTSPVPTSPVRTSAPHRTAAAKPAKQLFAIDDDDSSDSSDSSGSVVPPSRVQPRRSSVELTHDASSTTTTMTTKSKTRNASKREVVATEPASSRRRPSSTASHVSSAPVSTLAPAVVSAVVPPITGLPPRPNLFGGGRGDLLAAIRSGAELKKVDTAEPNGAVAPSGGSALKTRPAATAAAAAAPVGSISDAISNAMASRRIHVEYEETHSDDDDDSDDDWD